MSDRNAILDAINSAQRKMTERRNDQLQNANSGMGSATGSQISIPESSASTAVRVPKAKSANYVGAKDNHGDFVSTWDQRIKMFLEDNTRSTFALPAELSAFDRREIHQIAGKYNLSHHSEGVGINRQLVLKKDELHFRAPTMKPTKESIDTFGSENVMSRRQRHAQIERGPVEYADKDAAKNLRRLLKATDQYANAVESGMTMEEMQQAERGAQQQGEQQVGGAPGEPFGVSAWGAALEQGTAGESSFAPTARNEDNKRGRDDEETRDDDEELANRRKRPEAAPESKKEEVAQENDPFADLEPLSVQDAQDMARNNDMCDDDVAFVASFASKYHSDVDTIDRWMQFPIDFAEAALPPTGSSETVFVVKGSEGESPVLVSQALEKILAAVGDAAAKTAVVLLPGMSMYGADMVAALWTEGDHTAAVGVDVVKSWGFPEGAVRIGGRQLLEDAI